MPVQWGQNPAVSQSVFLLRDVIAARPAAAPANQDYYFLATDVSGGTLYQSTGAAWVQVAGSVTDVDTATFAGLTDVDTTGQVDQQVYAHRSSDGKVVPLPGVVGDGLSGLGITKSLRAGGAGSPTDETRHVFGGSVEIDQAQGDYLAQDPGLYIGQTATLDGATPLTQALWVQREIDRTADPLSYAPCAQIITHSTGNPTPLDELLLDARALDHGDGMRLNAAGGVGFFGATPPTVQPVGGAHTAAGTYGATEQTMLQAVYNAVRTAGLLS